MDFFTAMDVSASGLSAERVRMNVASSNLANAQVTRTPQGGPYQKQEVVLSSTPMVDGLPGVNGVVVQGIVASPDAPRLEYDPGHPDADAQGYVAYPDISPVQEMVDMITASRAYEAGVTVMDTIRTMARSAIQIGG